MAALDFPTSPTLNQTYTANGLTWKWDGTSWVTQNAGLTGTVQVSEGGTGATDSAGARANLGLDIGVDVQAWSADLDAIDALAGTSGFLKKTALDTWTLDTNTYLTSVTKADIGLGNVENTALSTWAGSANITTVGTVATGTWSATAIAVAKGGTGATDAGTARTNLGLAIGTNVQAYSADLAAIDALAGTSGFLKKTATDTWALDTNTYLTGNQSISISGDASGSGTTSISLTLATVGIAKGGTGQTTAAAAFNALSPLTTLGDIIYASGANTAARLAGNTTSTRQFLRQTGTGTVSAAPAWDTVTKTDVGLSAVENTALSTWAGSANITTVGTIATGTWSATAIAVAKGGTGATDAATARTNLGLAIGTNVQAWDADLDAIAALAGTSGLLKKTAANTWTLDTSTYLVSGGALGTPSSGTLTNCTSLPISTGVSGLGANVATFLATPSSANLLSAITGETGTGALVFGTSPSLSLPFFSMSGVLTAGTNAQGQCVLTNDINYIGVNANNPGGATLPTISTAGMRVVIINRTGNPVNVYPAANQYIDALAVNVPVSLPTPCVMEFYAYTTNRWYSSITESSTPLSTWAGSANITTVGTVATGTWSATAIAVAKGGTGATDAATARTNLGVPSTTGTGASGSWGISITGSSASCTGNAATATTATNLSGGTISATTATFSGLITGRSNATTFVDANDTGSISVRGDASWPAVMSFHRTGAYAVNFGLDTDNVLKVGGWSMGAVKYPILHTGNITANVPSGSKVLLNTLTASNSVSLQDTTSLTSTYDWYEIVLENVQVYNTSNTLYIQLQSGGSFQATNYYYMEWMYNAGGTAVQTSTIATYIPLCQIGFLANTLAGSSGFLRIFRPSNTTTNKHVVGQIYSPSSAATHLGMQVNGYWSNGTGAITGFQIVAASGNLLSGVVKIYGVKA